VRYLPATLIVCLGLFLTLTIFARVREWDAERTRTDFNRAAEERSSSLKRTISIKMLALDAIRSFYYGSVEVERYEFADFVRPLLDRLEGVQALEWVPRVPAERRAAYEAATIEKNGFRGFEITERDEHGTLIRSGRRAEYYPVYFVEPYAGNEAAVGFDLSSDTTRSEALERARDTGESVATARITLVQEKGEEFGFLVFLPVYMKGVALDTVESRRQNLVGFVLGVFRIADVVEKALAYLQPAGMDVLLCDNTAPPGEQILYWRPSPTKGDATGQRMASREDVSPDGLHHTATFDVGGRQWTIRCTPTPFFTAEHRTWYAWGVLVAGLMFTGLLGTYFFVSIGRAVRVQALVEERTKELRDAQERMIRHEKLAVLGQLAGGVGHELRNPLGAIKNAAYFLGMAIEKPEPEVKETLAIMAKEIGRCDGIIKSLLEYARPKAPLHRKVDVKSVLRSVAARVDVPGTVELVWELDEATPMVEGDPDQLAEVFENIIVNGIEAMSNGGPLVIRSRAANARHVAVSITDTGEGIPDENLGKLFEPLFSSKARGIGLGLAVVSTIVKAHDGTIEVESKAGKGTTFTVTLPVHGVEDK